MSPGTAVTGFPPGTVSNGTIHSADGVAAGAQSDLTTAYNDAAGRSPTANVPGFISAGQTLAPGVYKASSSLDVGGSLTLDGGGDPNAVFIFQAPSTLVTDSASSVILTNDAQACNVFWQVGSSATLGTNSAFTGSILALTSISVDTGDTIAGRALARNGAVTLDDDTITSPTCVTTPPTPTPTNDLGPRRLRPRRRRRRPQRPRDTHADADQARADADLYALCDAHADQARADADADADRHGPEPGAHSYPGPHPLPGDRLRMGATGRSQLDWTDLPTGVGAGIVSISSPGQCLAHDALGFPRATGHDETFRQFGLARIIEPTSKQD